ncbi:GxxExxY protein [Puniceicoccaceae bacterium K14]|nr:GxxExxY protein [Puniceicoccaceae bacterium K14]
MSTDDRDFLFKEETYQLIGAAFEVYNELGHSFLEAIYQEAYEHELILKKIQFVPQAPLRVRYKDKLLEKEYFADLIVQNNILIELKAIEKLTPREESQVLNYLRAANIKVGLLINFGSHPKLEYKRIVL